MYIPVLTETVFLAELYNALQPDKQGSSSGLGLLHAIIEYATEKQGLHRWSFDRLCRICLMAVQNRVFSLFLTIDLC